MGATMTFIENATQKVVLFFVRVGVQLLFFALSVALLAGLMLAGLSFDEKQYPRTILASGIVATAIFLLQVLGVPVLKWASQFFKTAPLVAPVCELGTQQPRRKSFGMMCKTAIVGVATHYAAIIIGVSFGGVFGAHDDSTWTIVAWLIQQSVVTYGAWVLVDQYRESISIRDC